ncbi:MAG: GspH/FimT family pseudopilin [Burkholderiaceae bacterium]
MLILNRPQRGVTLVEIAVVFVILGLLVVAAAPSIGTWIGNTHVRNTAASIYAGLNRARAEAVRSNRTVRFSLVSITDTAVMDDSCALSSTGASWVVSVNDPSGTCSAAPSATTNPMIVEKAAGGAGARRVVVSAKDKDDAAANTITFNPFGRVADATPIAWIDVDNEVSGGDYRKLRVLVGMGGVIRMCDVKVTDANDPRKC